jgi:hypothetical protein
MNRDVVNKNLERAKQSAEMLDDGQSTTPTTSSGFKNPYGDLKSLRMKVDSGMALTLMQKDLGEAANIFSKQNADVDIEANPYAVNEQEHKYRMAEIAATGEQARVTEAFKVKAASDQKKLDDGTHYKDKNGQIVPYENIENTYLKDTGAGNVTDSIDARKISKTISKQQAEKTGIPFMKNMLVLIEKMVDSNQMTEKEAGQILGHTNYRNISRQKFSEKLDKYGYYFLQNDIGYQDLSKIQSKFNSWVTKNQGLSVLKSQEYKDFQKSGLVFDDYTNYLKLNQKWNIDASKAVIKDLKSKGFKYADFLFDEKGNKNTEKEFNQALLKSGKVSQKDLAMIKIMKDEAAYRSKVNQTIDDATAWNPIGRMFAKGFANVGNYSPYKLYEGMFEKAMTKHFNYAELSKVMDNAYSYAKVLKSKINKLPGLAAGMIDPGTGLFTMGSTAISINPKYGKSKYIFNDVAGDIFSSFDLSNGKVSFDGISGTSFKNASSEKNAAAIAMLNALRASMQDPKSKLGQFEVAVSPIAGGKAGTSAVTFYPSAAWLKQFKSSGDDTDNVISQDDYVNAATKGITFFMDSDKLDNDLATGSYSSPLQTYVDHMGSYQYQDPRDPRKSYTIRRSSTGTGDYSTLITVPIFDPNTGQTTVRTYTQNVGVLGNNLEVNRDHVLSQFDMVDDFNTSQFNLGR